mmetsp:Transcript_106586/g.267169  ORF Transcript_106586/g.267169 Transcript_106586/m.267169 type:complete len:501 (-) Transcript_106586:114-1616(-)
MSNFSAKATAEVVTAAAGGPAPHGVVPTTTVAGPRSSPTSTAGKRSWADVARAAAVVSNASSGRRWSAVAAVVAEALAAEAAEIDEESHREASIGPNAANRSSTDGDSSSAAEPIMDSDAEAEDMVGMVEEPQPESEPGDEPEPEFFDEDSSEEVWEPEGKEQPARLKPGARGSRSCLCSGEVLVMLGHYGWLASLTEIDHPEAGKNGGRIYFHRRDVVGGVDLVEGDRVAFYLYVDSRGLGAEECRLEGCSAESAPVAAQGSPWDATRLHSKTPAPPQRQQQQERKQSECLRPGAAEFVPRGACAPIATVPAERAPTMGASAAPPASCMRATASEFVPTAQAGKSTYSLGFVPLGSIAAAPQKTVVGPTLNCFAFNDAYLSDDSDDEGSTSAGGSGGSDDGIESGCDVSDHTPRASPRASNGVQCGVALQGPAHVHISAASDLESAQEKRGGREMTDEFLLPPPGLLSSPPGLVAPPGLAPPPGLSAPRFHPPPGLRLP